MDSYEIVSTGRKNFGSHNVDVLVLGEMYNLTIERLNTSATGIPFDGLFEFNSAASQESLTGSTDQERIASFYG